MIDKGRTLVALAVIVMISPHDNVAVTVAVDVAGTRYAPAKFGVGLVGFNHRIRRGVDAGSRAVIDKGRAFVVLTVVVIIGTHDDIAVAVAVDVAGTRYANAQVRVRLVGFNHGSGCVVDAGSRAVVDKGRTLVYLAVVIPTRSHDDVSIAVAIDVARSRYAIAHVRACLVGFDHERGGGIDAGVTAKVDKSRALVVLTSVVKISPCDDIRIAVAVDVTGSRYADAHSCVYLVGFDHCGGNGVETGS